jgi:glycosyltransferase involved in cell wall biosynthesis
MKIALVMAHGRVHEHVGGAPKVFFEMANELGKDNKILALYSDDRPGSPLYKNGHNVTVENVMFDKNRLKRPALKFLREIIRGWNKLPLNEINYNPITSLQQSLVGELLRPKLNEFKPDVIISFGHWDLVSITEYYNSKAKIISMCHTDTSRVIPYMSARERRAMSEISAYHVLLPSYGEIVEKTIPAPFEFISFGNAVPDFNCKADMTQKRIVYMARVEKNKQHHKLLRSFSMLERSLRAGWVINFYGSEPDLEYKKHLIDLVALYELEDQVIFHGITKQPSEELIMSSICAFPSSFEGFPLALSEAMSSGLACVGFASCSGVNEIIQHEENGLLAHDEEDFSKCLASLMKSLPYRQKIGRNAYKTISRYHGDSVWDLWREELNKLNG